MCMIEEGYAVLFSFHSNIKCVCGRFILISIILYINKLLAPNKMCECVSLFYVYLCIYIHLYAFFFYSYLHSFHSISIFFLLILSHSISKVAMSVGCYGWFIGFVATLVTVVSTV